MKALHQIIDYLRRSGLLSQEQLVEFASQGILRWDQVYQAAGDETESEPQRNPPWLLAPEDLEVEEPGREAMRPPPGRRGPARRRTPVLSTEELCARLRQRAHSWKQPLAGLTRLAGYDTWQDAARAVRNPDPDTLLKALAEGLRTQNPTLPALWAAIDLEEHRGAVWGGEMHGPVVNSYRALLSGRDHGSLGHHVWLLREPEVVDVVNLVRAQRRLLAALGVLLAERPDLVATALRRDGLTPGYWPLVLTYTARRGQPGRRPWPHADEHPPPRQPPPPDDWPRRWGQAVAMDPAAVTAFLFEHTAQQVDRPRLLTEALRGVISALPDGPADIAFRFYGRQSPVEQVALVAGLSRDEVARHLADFRQTIRHALAREAALRVFLQPAPPHCLEAFLADCLRWTWGTENHLFNTDLEGKLAELIAVHYGPALGLLCPRAWD